MFLSLNFYHIYFFRIIIVLIKCRSVFRITKSGRMWNLFAEEKGIFFFEENRQWRRIEFDF